jgi:acetyl esterase/lipase
VASKELDWAIQQVARDRASAGVSPDRYDIAAARASLPTTELPMPEGTEVRYAVLDGVTCFWVSAPGADPDRRIVFLHGGGYLGGGFHSHRSLVGWLSAKARAAVLFVEYRLAPEYRFPAGLDDAVAATRAAAAAGPDGMPRPARALYVVGDSAGGGMAASVLLRARDGDCPMPAAAAILCGMLDLDEETSKFLQLTQRSADMVRLYVRRLADLRSPYASQMLADLRGLPPMLVQTGSADYCRDECERFAARAEAAGVKASLEVWPDMIHVWHRFAPRLPEAMEALARIGTWFEEQERAHR